MALFRIIYTIVTFGLALLFIYFNMNNKGSLSLVFVELKEVPIFLISGFSFLLGLIVSAVFMMTAIFSINKKKINNNAGESKSSRKKNGSKKIKDESKEEDLDDF